MKKTFAVRIAVRSIALVALAGCAELPVSPTVQGVAGCRIADTVITFSRLHSGAVEANPIAKLLIGIHPLVYVAAQAMIVWVVWRYETPEQEGKEILVFASCAPVVFTAIRGVK